MGGKQDRALADVEIPSVAGSVASGVVGSCRDNDIQVQVCVECVFTTAGAGPIIKLFAWGGG